MILIVTEWQFDKESLTKYFSDEEPYLDSVGRVTLSLFGAESDKALTDDSITAFAELMEKYFPDKKLVKFSDVADMSPDTAVRLIKHKKFLKHLSDDAFLKLIVSSDVAAKYALSDQAIRERLNKYEERINSQTFDKSCTARSLLIFLLREKIISDSEFTRCNELEIYRQIWSKPGDIADPQKIVEFFTAKKANPTPDKKESKLELKEMPFEVSGFESESHSKNWLDQKDPLMQHAYTLFKAATKNKFLTLKAGEKVNEKAFPINSSLLLAVVNNVGMHIVIAHKTKEGKLEIMDPGDGKKTSYESMTKFLEAETEFLGVGYQITARKAA
jgi:hypothetical protein